MNKKLLPLIGILLVTISSCASVETDKYVPHSEKKKERLATPEPGTFLKPSAYRLLKKLNRYMEDPESFHKPPDWVIDAVTPRVYKTVDTVIRYNHLDVPLRIYYPGRKNVKANQPVILFIHGGGFVTGSVDEYDMFVAKMAKETRTVIVSVEYRLAPEHPFPQGLEDCFAALRWLQTRGNEIGVDSGRICLMGDSAGGNLATVLTLMCRDRKLPEVSGQILYYPATTFVDTIFPSRKYFATSPDMDFVLNEKFLRKVKKEYMGDFSDPYCEYLSPLEASLTPDLPPALIITAECDPLRDGGRSYAEKLDHAGVKVTFREYSGMIHGFMSFYFMIEDARDAMERTNRFLDHLDHFRRNRG